MFALFCLVMSSDFNQTEGVDIWILHQTHFNIKYEFMKKLNKDQAEKAAQGLAALIDGFWLRGALVNGEIDPELPIELCSEYIRQQLK